MGSIVTSSSSVAQFEYLFSLVCLGDNIMVNDELSRCNQRQIQHLLDMRDNDKMNGMNLVMYAAHYGQSDVLVTLLSYEPDLSKRDANGRDALHHAIISQDVETVTALVDRVDVNSLDMSDASKLHMAAQADNEEIIRLLLERKAKVNVADVDGVTPLHLAVDQCNVNIVKLLVGRKGNPNAKDKWGWTPMHIAAAHNHLEMLQLLVSQGGQINVSDKCGNTPLRWAKEAKSKQTLTYLRKSGARINDDRYAKRQTFSFADLGSVQKI